jgi:hypothetical protein
LQVVPVSGGGGKIEFFFSLERFVTDIPVSVYARNVCTFAFNTKSEKLFFQKAHTRSNTYYLRVTMPDGKLALTSILRCARYPGYWPSNYTEAFGSKSRLLPVYLQEANSSGDHQFFGYIPDMYFGNNSGSLFSWYNHRTFGGIWMRFAELCLPVFDTSYSTSLGDTAGAACVIASSSDTIGDTVAPMFAGIVSATAVDKNTIRLAWESGYDDVSLHEALIYEIHCSTSAGATFRMRGKVVGTITHDVTLLKPNTTYYFRVRCRDEAGNVDSNSVEISATTPGAEDPDPPTVTVESPTPNTDIEPNDALVIRITDAGGLRLIPIWVYYPSKPELPMECVWSSKGFNTRLYLQSTREQLVENKDYRYNIRRSGGWPAAPSIHIDPVDNSGNNIT